MPAPKRGRDFWGPSIWTAIHSIAAAYTPEHAEAVKMFMYSLTELLPCEQCRKNLMEKLGRFPIDMYLSNNNDLFFWTYIIHDAANQYHNQHKPNEPPKISPSFEEVKIYYFRALSDECKECRTV